MYLPDGKNALPLTSAQHGIWFSGQLAAGAARNDIAELLTLTGPFEVEAFSLAVQQLFNEVESLRLHIVSAGDTVSQTVESSVPSRLIFKDFSGEAAAEEAMHHWINAELQACAIDDSKNFDETLSCLALFRLGPDKHAWYLRAHHLVADGYCGMLWVNRTAELYNALRQGVALEPCTFSSLSTFLEDERRYRTSRYFERDKAFWAQELVGLPQPPALSLKRLARSAGVHRQVINLDSAARKTLKQLAQGLSIDLPALLIGLVLFYTCKMNNQASGLIGLAASGRLGKVARSTPTTVSNILPLRVNVEPGCSLGELLRLTQLKIRAVLIHQRYRIEDIRKAAGLLEGARPLFRVAANYMGFDYEVPFGEATFERENVATGVSEEANIEFYDYGDGKSIAVHLVFDGEQFADQEVRLHAQRFKGLIDQLPACMNSPLASISVLAPDEQRKLVHEDAPVTLPEPVVDITFVHEHFESQAQRRPDAIAVSYQDSGLSYAQLNARANRLAWFLKKDGVGPGCYVAICIDRSLDVLIALLAVLKTGAAYIPLDPGAPVARLQWLIADSHPAVVLTQTHLMKVFEPAAGSTSVLDIGNSTPWRDGSTQNLARSCTLLAAEDVAYVIYTSGSTGNPKGVMVTHANLARLFSATQAAFELTAGDVWAQFHSIAFDFSVWEIWGALVHGGRVVVVPQDTTRSADALHALICKEHITVLNQTPSAFKHVVAAQRHDSPAHELRLVILGGETVDVRALAPWHANPLNANTRLVNIYGATETTVFATWCNLSPGEPSPYEGSVVGVAISDLQVLILDDDLVPLPFGVTGQIYIGGAGVAKGYLNRPELTAERFLVHPFRDDGARLYKTGDLGRWLPDGTLAFFGRNDYQVKLHGYRIELGEIEKRLSEHPAVDEAVVTVQAGSNEEPRLVAYVSMAEQGSGSLQQVRNWHQFYEQVYATTTRDGDIDFTGWDSTYTATPIPARQMREWLENTLLQLKAEPYDSVLEIGCGTGLLLSQLAGQAERYVGVDFSAQVIRQLRAHCQQTPWLQHVQLHEGQADEMDFVQSDSVDLVILNSVIQYFPDADYLLRVLRQAVRVTRPGGRIFVGDVRNLDLLEAYHTSVQMFNAPDDLPLVTLRQRVRKAIDKEPELLVAPRFFRRLAEHWPEIGHVVSTLKPGDYDNELTRFRYDTTLHVGPGKSLTPPVRWLDWAPGINWLLVLDEALGSTRGPVAIAGIRDARVAGATAAWARLHDELSLSDLRALGNEAGGDNPHDWVQLAKALSVGHQWQLNDGSGHYHLVFRPQWRAGKDLPTAQAADLREGTNTPVQGNPSGGLAQTLKTFLGNTLPAYMVPAVIVVLPAFELNINGKIDRSALPAAVSYALATTGYVPPEGELELRLASIWRQVLGVERVGRLDNFFELGGYSLLAVQLIKAVKQVFGTTLTIKDVFANPLLCDQAQLVQALGHVFNRLPYDHLFALRSTGTRPTLFCIHPGHGFGWCYARLLPYLHADRPLYSLQAKGLEVGDDLPQSMQALARAYVAQLRQHQPQGPYHLVGWSFGAVAAHAIATELQAQNETVDFLCLIDSYPANEVLRCGAADDPSAGGGDAFDPAYRRAEIRKYVDIHELDAYGAGNDEALIERIVEVSYNHECLLLGYRPQVYKGDVLFFAASRLMKGLTEKPSPQAWKAYVTGSIEVHQVDALHGDMLTEPAVQVLARTLDEKLRRRAAG